MARKVGDVVPFFESEVAKQTVSRLLPYLNRYQIEDVAKMLHVIAKELHMNTTLSDKVKAHVQQKRQYRKPLSFVKK